MSAQDALLQAAGIAASPQASSSALLIEDTVTIPSRSSQQCIVFRIAGDLDAQALLELPLDDEMRYGPDRPLQPGEIQVVYRDGTNAIVQHGQAQLQDRPFVRGDLARRRSGSDKARGIVLSMHTRVKLEGVFSKQEVEGWVNVEDLVNAIRITRGDHVCAGDWVGVVEEVFEEAVVSLRAGGTFKICDIGSGMLNVGATSDQVMQDRFMAGVFPQAPPSWDIVLESGPTVVAVNWFALNQKVPTAQHDQRPRPKRFWSDLDKLSIVRSSADHLHSVGDRVLFRHTADAARHNAASPQRANAANAFTITHSSTTVELLWQDGTRSTVPSSDLVPCTGLDDEHDLWPGDLALYVAEGEASKKVAVVQSMDAQQRTVDVRWYGTSEFDTVSALDLDGYGPPPDAIGVRRGDLVLILATPSPTFPTVSKIGETELNFPAEETLRNQLTGLGMAFANHSDSSLSARRIMSGPATSEIDYYGEVVDLQLDGKAVVRFASGREEVFSQDHLVIFDDAFDHELGWGGGNVDGMMEEDGLDDEQGSTDGSWMTDEGPDEFLADDTAEIKTAEIKLDEPHASEEDVEMEEVAGALIGDKAAAAELGLAASGAEGDEGPWQRFVVLEQAPQDHHYINEPIQPPTKAFSQRIQKEYKALEESLPDNILVRAYEDRIDLMRCLIMGPSNTPYQDAPFVFDIFLPPSKYPHEAPQVFFQSWTNGAGRVNPNLYMEGKVCLSLLGTWSGEKTESWNPQRSSVFQILVSIQGLVLVKEPWYLEPGFEKQRGTAEGAAAAQLYTERTWVLSRSQIRRAVERPPAGLAAALRFFYYTPGRGRLQYIVDEVKRVLATVDATSNGSAAVAQEAGTESTQWPEKITKGSAIPLKRTLAALEKALAAGPPPLPVGDE